MKVVSYTTCIGKNMFYDDSICFPHVKWDIFHFLTLLQGNEHEIIKQVVFASGWKYIHNLLVQVIHDYTYIITVMRLEGVHFIQSQAFRKLSSGDVDMFVENINNRCSGYAISSSDISKGCIWSLEISENIEYSSYRESSSKSEGIIFIECLLAVGTLVSQIGRASCRERV